MQVPQCLLEMEGGDGVRAGPISLARAGGSLVGNPSLWILGLADSAHSLLTYRTFGSRGQKGPFSGSWYRDSLVMHCQGVQGDFNGEISYEIYIWPEKNA
tara:strand:+ start:186 stop:485 length:300 start_codon:yes stop_codon:yes gene_type:complete